MPTEIIITLALALLVGLTIGALGAGGSVLALPIFVYIAGIPPAKAVAMSLVVVGGASLAGAVLHYYRGHFHARAALTFAITGVLGAFLGAYLTHLVSGRVLMLIFAALLLAAGVAMLANAGESERKAQCRIAYCLLLGAGVGALTGFIGVGGGFMIVPALVLFAGIDAKKALGSSLTIITLNSAAGLIGHLRHLSLDWRLTVSFLGLALLGMLSGVGMAEKIPAQTLQKAFGWFISAIALLIGGMSAFGVAMPAGT